MKPRARARVSAENVDGQMAAAAVSLPDKDRCRRTARAANSWLALNRRPRDVYASPQSLNQSVTGEAQVWARSARDWLCEISSVPRRETQPIFNSAGGAD